MSFSVKIFGEELELENKYNIKKAIKNIETIYPRLKFTEEDFCLLCDTTRNIEEEDSYTFRDSDAVRCKVPRLSKVFINANKGYHWCPFRKDFIFEWIDIHPEEIPVKTEFGYFKCESCHKVYCDEAKPPKHDEKYEDYYEKQRLKHQETFYHKQYEMDKKEYRKNKKEIVDSMLYNEAECDQFHLNYEK